MSTSWRLLDQYPSESRLPPLLISTLFTSNSYTVNITDLTYIWSESLHRRSIIKRSLDEDTSIDPSEDAEQLRVFLDKIKSGLSGGENTKLSLHAQSKSKPDGPAGLNLHITASLPKPLKPLEWPIYLSPSPQSSFSAQLLVPILRAQNARMRELSMLVDILRDKDHVIQKLADKLEATGAELGRVFPSAVGKGGRKIPRKQAEERVKGLGVFDADEWRKEMRMKEKDNESEDVRAMVKQVLETDIDASNSISEAPTSWDEWWNSIGDNLVEFTSGGNEAEDVRAENKAPNIKGETTLAVQDNDDDFQIHATPPLHDDEGPAVESEPVSSAPTLRSHAIIEDSTADEDDLDGPSQKSVVQDSFPASPPRKQPRKLGTIDRAKIAARTASPVPIKTDNHAASSKVKEDHPMAEDEETATEDEEDQAPPKAITAPKKAPTPPPAKPKRGGLGLIKGKKADEPPTEDAASEEAALPERKPKHKLGVIGRKAAASTEPETSVKHEDEMSRGRAGTNKEEVAAPRETSKERADRKREELKRQLEEKAKAPVKKKRKF